MNKSKLLIAMLLVIGMITNGFATELEMVREGKLHLTLSATKTNCPDDPNGSATATVTGGKSPYSYKWSNGAITATINNVVADGYFITVTDAEGTTKNGHILVEATNELKVSFNQRTLSCTHQTDGKIEAIPEGGVAPFTYIWNDGTQNSYIENIGAGMYMVTVADANGCQAESVVMFEEPDPLRIKAYYMHVSCGEDADGSMEVIASGGAGNYSFEWELDGEGGTKREGLKPGLYSVTVTDGNGCTAMICPEILQSQPPILSASFLPETCPGEGDGRGTVSPQGDSPPYTYAWPNGESQHSTAFGLTTGTYVVTVTNFRNCTATVEVKVEAAGGGFGFVVETNGATCGNVAGGQASVRITGGVEPFTYQWIDESTNNVLSNNATITGLTAGNYEVLVTDVNGCFGKKDVLIVEKPVPTVTATTINGTVCFGEKTGGASALATGGEGPYSYQWSNGQEEQTIDNLAGGTYSVTATDINGCEAVANVVINERNQLFINEQITNLLCHDQADGEIVANASGGSGTYSYLWSNGATTDRINNLLAGTHYLTLTDSEGCQIIKGINIGQPSALELTVSSTNASDLNSSDGSATVTANGGTAPYIYEWSNDATTPTITNLPEGTYTVRVTDANGCTKAVVVVVDPSCTISATISNVQAVGCAINDGTITVATTGAKGTVTYAWSNGQTGATANNLTGGTYTVTVTDANGCTATASSTLAGRTPIEIGAQVTDLLCNNEAGGAIITMVSGGTNSYTYAWSNGANTANINSILAGDYTLTVTDSDGCQAVKLITMGQPTPLALTPLTVDAADENTADGSASVTVTGGTAPYQYEWSNGGTGASINNVSAGAYTVRVTDANGCQSALSIEVAANCTLKVNISDIQPTSCQGNDGSITLTVTGAKGAVNYNWTNDANTSAIAGLAPGFYGVTVTDGNGCQYASGAFVGDACDCIQPVLESALVFEANCGVNDGSIKIEMQGDNNNFNYQWSDPAISGTGAAGLGAGSYMVTITDKNNPICSTIETIHIGNTNVGPVIILRNDPEICNGQKGTVLLVPGTLTFKWSDDKEGSFRDDLSAGEYQVTVTNPALEGCSDILTVKVEQESGLTISPTINQLPDCGFSNGSVTIGVEGGSGDYSYSWGSATQNNLPSGTYSIQVRDKVTSCTESILFTLSENVPSVNFTIDSLFNASCAGAVDGRVHYTFSESTDFDGPAVIKILDGTGKEYPANALPAGSYCLVASDAKGCLAGQLCFDITDPEFLLVNVTVIPKSCSVENTILLTTSGGNGIYTYDWADLDGEINLRDRREIPNGSYSVTVKDKAGCTVIAENITINGECFICSLEAEVTKNAIPECGLPNGAATISVDNVFGNLSYSWGETANRNDLLAGDYTVTVTDDYRGCTTEVSFQLIEPELKMEATISELIVCDNETGKLEYELDNFRCFKQPIGVTITDDNGNIYDENALPAFGNYIFIIKDADDIELHRQFFSVEGYVPIIADANIQDEGCTTPGAIDLDLANPLDNYTIQWEDLDGANQPADRAELKEGSYSVTIADDSGAGCAISRTFDVGKNTGLEATITPEMLTCDKAPVQLNLEGVDILLYQWSPAELVMAGQNTASPTIQPVEEETTIMVKGTNAFGCTVEKTVKITSIDTNLKGKIEMSPQCNGLTIDFSNKGLSPDYYIWDFGDGNTSEAINPSHTYAQGGDYEVVLRLKPNVPCAADKDIIANQSLNLVDNAQAVADFKVNYDPCQDEGLVRFEDLSQVNPGIISSWKWDFGNGMTSEEQHPQILLTEDAELDVSLTITSDIGCGSDVINTQAFKVVNIAGVPAELQICPDIPTAINPNPEEGVSYEWSPAQYLDNPLADNPIATANESQLFRVTITKGVCIREQDVQVNVPKEQDYTLSEDEAVCDTDARPIFVMAPEKSTIEWSNALTGEQLGTESEIMVSPGVYKVILTDENNCPVSDTVWIDNYEIDALIEDNTDPCEDGNGTLEVVNSSGEPITNYQWQEADGIISPDLDQNSIEVEPGITSEYTVSVKNEFGCEAMLTETVSVSTLEEMLVLAERDTIFKGESTAIEVTPAGNYSVEWSPIESLEGMSTIRQIAKPSETTTYTVTIIDNETGCEIIREITIFVKEVVCGEPNIFFPNAFSPNGDGNNDILRVRGNGLSEVYFAIYNRWGELVFESNSQDVGWDGTYQGVTVSTDVYGYYLRVTCFDGEVFEKTGNVTVLN